MLLIITTSNSTGELMLLIITSSSGTGELLGLSARASHAQPKVLGFAALRQRRPAAQAAVAATATQPVALSAQPSSMLGWQVAQSKQTQRQLKHLATALGPLLQAQRNQRQQQPRPRKPEWMCGVCAT